jgi:sortase (surface protein transpeptidase)
MSDLGIDAPIIAAGVAADGRVQVPPDVGTVGWYRFGPAPGATGSAVLVGHVDDQTQGAGVLARIGDLEPGDLIDVVGDDGKTRRFSVVAREQWPKEQTPMARLFDRGGQPRLVLITCGGHFDEERLEYDDNIAVTAAPIG